MNGEHGRSQKVSATSMMSASVKWTDHMRSPCAPPDQYIHIAKVAPIDDAEVCSELSSLCRTKRQVGEGREREIPILNSGGGRRGVAVCFRARLTFGASIECSPLRCRRCDRNANA